jgi:hypothetical protein
VSSVQVEYAMHRDMGNDEAAMGCIARIQQLQRELAALRWTSLERTMLK